MAEAPTAIDSSLRSFIPPDVKNIKLNKDYFKPVINKIAQVLPKEEIFRLFTSVAEQAGGTPEFPFCVVDGSILDASQAVDVLETYTDTNNPRWSALYQVASKEAFKALVWVEVGFEGFENFAKSPAAESWTASGYDFTPENRALMLTEGKEIYKSRLERFTHYRSSHAVPKDLFDTYHLESLLTPFK